MSIRIDTYVSENSPVHRRWMAFIRLGDKRGSSPMFFEASTEDRVRELAQDFWNGELAKVQSKADAAAKRAESRKARAA